MDATYAHIEEAATRLGISRNELFSRAADRWPDALEGAGTTTAIDAALADGQEPTEFAEHAARDLAAGVDW